jgi:hypothetical protein
MNLRSEGAPTTVDGSEGAPATEGAAFPALPLALGTFLLQVPSL